MGGLVWEAPGSGGSGGTFRLSTMAVQRGLHQLVGCTAGVYCCLLQLGVHDAPMLTMSC